MDTAAEKGSMFGMDEGKRLNVGRKNNFLKGKWGKRRKTLAARRVRVLRVKGIGCERWRWLDSWNAEGHQMLKWTAEGVANAIRGKRRGRTARRNARRGAEPLPLLGKMT